MAFGALSTSVPTTNLVSGQMAQWRPFSGTVRRTWESLHDREEGCVSLAHPRHETILQPGDQAHSWPPLLAFAVVCDCLQGLPSALSWVLDPPSAVTAAARTEMFTTVVHKQPGNVVCAATVGNPCLLSSVLLFLGKFTTPLPHYPKDSLAQETRRCLGAARVPKFVSPMDEGCKSREGKRLS